MSLCNSVILLLLYYYINNAISIIRKRRVGDMVTWHEYNSSQGHVTSREIHSIQKTTEMNSEIHWWPTVHHYYVTLRYTPLFSVIAVLISIFSFSHSLGDNACGLTHFVYFRYKHGFQCITIHYAGRPFVSWLPLLLLTCTRIKINDTFTIFTRDISTSNTICFINRLNS